MRQIETRLTELETRTGRGGYLIVDTRELSDDQAKEAIAQANRQVGRNGLVVVLEYAKAWNNEYHETP
jgi:predicted RNA-binding protein YlxR (DUF448 family)